MTLEQLKQLTNDELLKVAQDNKPKPIFDAFFIGFLIGILIFGAAASAWGLTMLIPLYLIYLFLKKPKNQKAIQNELNSRNLSLGN